MKRKALHVVLCAALTLGASIGFEAAAQNTVRPEVGRPLQAAQALVKQRKGREALAEVAKAEAVPNRTAAENQVIQQMKGSAALAAGDNDAVMVVAGGAAGSSTTPNNRRSGGGADPRPAGPRPRAPAPRGPMPRGTGGAAAVRGAGAIAAAALFSWSATGATCTGTATS